MIRILSLTTIASLFWACAEPNTGNFQGEDTLFPDDDHLFIEFPHPENWDRPEAHGVASLTQGPRLKKEDRCNSCHSFGADTLDGAPGCLSCHKSYPHVTGWGDSALHVEWLGVQPSAFRSSLTVNCATSCHGTDLQGGLSTVACTDCHADYPHEEGYVAGTTHGFDVLANAATRLQNCQSCHGDDLDGGTYAVSCQICHSLPDSNAPVVHKPVQTNACASCHATEESGVNGPHLLQATAPDLCWGCHSKGQEGKPFTHGAATSGDACAACHAPHTSEREHLLTGSGSNLCFGCHDQVINSATYGTTRNIKAITQKSSQHAPFAEGNCGQCHDAHGADFDHLLKKNDPMFFLCCGASVPNYSCFDCHNNKTSLVDTSFFVKPNPVVRPSNDLPTQFVELWSSVAMNLHWKHVIDLDIACLGCHDPHGENDPYLVRNYITYSDPGSNNFWSFSSCNGCHANQFPSGYPNDLW